MSASNITSPFPAQSPASGSTNYINEFDQAFQAVDAHDHSTSKGLPVQRLGSGAVDGTTLEVASNAARVRAGGITANELADGTITLAKLIAAVQQSLVPAGAITGFGGAVAPSGYLLCDGSAVSRITYSALFGAIGVVHGAGDGTTTFNLPNGVGRVLVGSGTYTDPTTGAVTRTLGAILGESTHVLSVGEMPSHDHGGGSHTHTFNDNYTTDAAGSSGGGGGPGFSVDQASLTGTTSGPSGTVVAAQGGGAGHNIMQPSFVGNYIIKT